MSVSMLLQRLQKVKKTGDGRWRACCPAHGDRNPSMAVRELPDGRVLLHCFSHGCGAADIMAAVGLQLTALFPEPLYGFPGREQKGGRFHISHGEPVGWDAEDVLQESVQDLESAQHLLAKGQLSEDERKAFSGIVDRLASARALVRGQ